MSVCHVVVLVQDHFVDPNLMEIVSTAEMLRPSSLALNRPDGTGQVVEYFPEFVVVHNKAGLVFVRPNFLYRTWTGIEWNPTWVYLEYPRVNVFLHI